MSRRRKPLILKEGGNVTYYDHNDNPILTTVLSSAFLSSMRTVGNAVKALKDITHDMGAKYFKVTS